MVVVDVDRNIQILSRANMNIPVRSGFSVFIPKMCRFIKVSCFCRLNSKTLLIICFFVLLSIHIKHTSVYRIQCSYTILKHQDLEIGIYVRG